jgi:S-DNA-T family DNA segregation ATPase FtsK/SpoIIIE
VPLPGNLLGPFGRVLFRIQVGALGFGSVAIPAGLGLWGWSKMRGRPVSAPSVKSAGWVLALISFVTLLGLAFSSTISSGVAAGLYAGGLAGYGLAMMFSRILSPFGTVLVCLCLAGVSLYLLEKEALVKNGVLQLYERLRIWIQTRREFKAAAKEEVETIDPTSVAVASEPEAPKVRVRRAKPVVLVAPAEVQAPLPPPAEPAPAKALSAEDRARAAEAFLKNRQAIKVSAGGPRLNEAASASAVTAADEAPAQPITVLKDYKLPEVALLKEGSGKGLSAPSDYQAVSATLEQALLSFGVNAKVVEVCPGPTVTRYEIGLAPGVKMSRVVTLADDIALAAKVGNVRIEGPIQGKGT